MTSVSFTPLPSLSHDNLCSGRLSILAITGVSDTIPPRLILPRADGAVGADPSLWVSSARRRAARPFAGWRQRQIFGGAVTDTRPNERGGLGDG